MKVIRDVSCTSSLHYDSELRGAAPNPLDFRSVMEKIRGKAASFLSFFLVSLPRACYSPRFLRAYCDVRKIDLLNIKHKQMKKK